MSSKKKMIKKLEKISKKFLLPNRRVVLLDSLKGDRVKWFSWVSQIKGILNILNKAEAIKFSGLILLLEQNPDSHYYQDKIKKFLIDRVELYQYYDFGLEKEISKEKAASKKLWITKIFRCFISRSFVGILIIILIIGFVAWFYIDRTSCLEFVQAVIQPFLKAIK